MKLDYVFKQYDYVVCTGLERDQIQSLVDRMVECGANDYEGINNYFKHGSNTLAWDVEGGTYFLAEEYWSEDDNYTEVKWKDIVKEAKPKSLREMFPNGMYTDNSEEVFDRFKELLEADYDEDDERYYNPNFEHIGLDFDNNLDLTTYFETGHGSWFGECSTYLTNEEFFAIELGDTTPSKAPEDDIRSYGCFQQVAAVIGEERALEELGKVEDWYSMDAELSSAFNWYYSIQGWYFWSSVDIGEHPEGLVSCLSESPAPDSDDQLGFDSTEEPNHTIGYLIEQIQLNTVPNSPEVIIGKNGDVVLYGLDLEINVSGKSADEIDKIYQALSTLMDA